MKNELINKYFEEKNKLFLNNRCSLFKDKVPELSKKYVKSKPNKISYNNHN